jgi:type IV secretion system protein VirB6
VLALATQWPAWQVLIFDVATAGPQDIAETILPPGGLGGEDRSGMAIRLQAASTALSNIAHPDPTRAQNPGDQVQQPGQPQATSSLTPTQLSTDGLEAIDAAQSVLLVTGLAGMVAVRGIAGLLLALGPLFIGFLLFAATRSLFISWARALAGVALGAVAISAMLALELSVVEPQIVGLQQEVTAGDPFSPLPLYIWVSTVVFAVLTVASVVMIVRVAAGLRLPDALRLTDDRDHWHRRASEASPPPSASGAASGASGSQGRAEHIADVVRANERRDAIDTSISTQEGRRIAFGNGARPAVEQAVHSVAAPAGLGGAVGRGHLRQSGAAGRRDNIL